MLLTPDDLDQFYQLHNTLMVFVNQRLQVIPDKVSTAQEYGELAPQVRVKVRDALTENLGLIESFVAENPARLTAEELDIVRSWQHLLAGKFYILRDLKNYTVFLSPGSPAVAYGVLALSQPFEDLVGPYLPVMVQTVLLPFKNRIVYDGLMSSYNVSFGPGIRRNLNEDFKEAKERLRVLELMVRSGGRYRVVVVDQGHVNIVFAREGLAGAHQVVLVRDQVRGLPKIAKDWQVATFLSECISDYNLSAI